jgi:uncharacterized membrane protein YccF (DUF307 family)
MAELASGRLHLCAMIVEFKSCMPALIAGMTSGHDKWWWLRSARHCLHNSQVLKATPAIMSPIALVLNVLWIIFGGLWMAVGWVIAAVVMAITIIGIPWARAAFNIASYTLLPFGRKAVSRAEYSGHDIGTGLFGLIGNVIWLVLAGWWLALGHLITAVLLAVTIIGIPFAWAHLKLAGVALWPIGKEIVAAEAVPLRYTRPQV